MTATAKQPRWMTGKPKAAPREKKGPHTLPCGCNALGHCCSEESVLWGRLESALAAWKGSGLSPGEEGFPAIYRPVLLARRAYQSHFRLTYDMSVDPLLLDHRECLSSKS